MKTFICLFALAILLNVSHARVIGERNVTRVTRGDYGSSSYGRIDMVKPVVSTYETRVPVAPIVQMEQPRSDYGAQQVQQPLRVVQTTYDAPVQQPLRVVQTTYQQEAAPVQQQTYTVVQQQPIVRDEAPMEILEPELRNMCVERKEYGRSIFYLPHPSKRTHYIQCDEFGAAYLKRCPEGTFFTSNLVCEAHEEIPQQPIVQMEQQVHTQGAYGAAPVFAATQQDTSMVRTNVEVIQEAPEFRELCLSKRTSGVSVFYLPHPTDQSRYIQCDEFGAAFLKSCPAGLVFTTRLTCERLGEIQQDVTPIVAASSGYGNTLTTTALFAEVPVVEAPEFRELCVSSRRAGVAVFHIRHPTQRTHYIQCDESDRAFLKACPAGMFFTHNLVCETTEEETVQIVQAAPANTGYGQAIVKPAFEESIIVSTTEAPEFASLCASRRTIGGAAIFYLPHPSKRTSYIQCDEFGKAFLKDCPANTVFTNNLVCENVADIVDVTPVVQQQQVQLDHHTQGSYGAAPVFTQQDTTSIVKSSVEVVREAPEFRELCASKRTTGLTVFYIQHPTDQSHYIQCDEFGAAFLKECPAGTVFTLRMTCEKLSELHLSAEAPVSSNSYGQQHVQIVQREEAPRPVITTSYAAPIVRAEAPRPVITTSYAAPIVREEAPRPVIASYAAPIVRHEIVRPVIQRVEVPRPVFRAEPISTSYGFQQQQPLTTSFVLQKQPVFAATPVVRAPLQSATGYGQLRASSGY